MRRRISILLASALAAAGFVVLGPSQPASAWQVCTGTGTATVTPGLLYPVTVTNPSKTPSLMFDVLIGQGNPTSSFGFTAINCVHQGTLVNKNPATGVVKGYCGLSSGRGTFANGDLFAWVGVGGLLILTGHVVGVVNAIPDPTTGQSCTHTTLPAGATEFVVTGVAVLLNCTAALQTLVPGTPGDTEVLVPLVTTQHLNAVFHVLVNLGLHFYFNHQCVGNPVL